MKNLVRTSQPQGAVGVDWGNPISRGLSWISMPHVRLSGFAQVPAFGSPVGLVTTTNQSQSVVSAADAYTTAQPFHTLVYVSAWSLTGATNSLMGVRNGGVTSGSLYLLRGSSGVSFYYANAANSLTQTSGQSIPASGAGAIVARTGASAIDVFVGGVLAGSVSIPNLYAGASGINSKDCFATNTPGALAAYFNRALTDAEIASISANPWQLFAPIQQQIFVPASVIGIYRPNTDIITNGWTPTNAGSLATAINETVASTSNFITSPNLTSPTTLGLDKPLPAGSWQVKVQAARSAGAGQIRVRFLDSSSVDVGGTGWQTLTQSLTIYTLSAATTSTADRFRIEVQA